MRPAADLTAAGFFLRLSDRAESAPAAVAAARVPTLNKTGTIPSPRGDISVAPRVIKRVGKALTAAGKILSFARCAAAKEAAKAPSAIAASDKGVSIADGSADLTATASLTIVSGGSNWDDSWDDAGEIDLP